MPRSTNRRRLAKVKYVAKVPIGKNSHRYFYTNEEYQAYLKNKNSSINYTAKGITNSLKDKVDTGKDKIKNALSKIDDKIKEGVDDVTFAINSGTSKVRSIMNQVDDKIKDSVDKIINTSLPAAANHIVDKGKQAVNELYKNTDNIYDVTKYNYEEKIAQIKQTEEWKNIINSNNSEYVKKNSDGTIEYLIDDYLVDKKHPVLDAIGDITSGREVSVNRITKDTAVAGLKDTVRGSITVGMLATNAVTQLLTEKFKFGQGSYEDEIQTMTDTINRGAEYISDVASNKSPDMTSIMQTVNTVNNTVQISKAIRSEINETTVVNAAKVVIDTTDDFSVSKAEKALTNLSDEEIQALCVLLNAISN